MSRDLDTRARQAAAGLKAAVSEAELTSVAPGMTTRRRLAVAILRPAWIVALLLIGSAVGVAMVLDSSPTPTTAPPPPTTIVTTPATVVTTVPSTIAPPTTAAAVVPVAPTSTTVAPDTEPPLLEITSPEDGAEFEEKKITFSGITEPGARVFAGQYEADVDSSGEWHIVLILSEGSNVARFVARDSAGNESEASVTVYYVTPTTTTTEPETTTTEKELAEFSANSMYEFCSDFPPFNVYYGTGEPGSWVEISSEYGSAEVVVAENGEWEKTVVFSEETPPDEPFGVRISDQYGRVKEFQFVYKP
ncbi:MAG: hypothetical protein PVG83_09865 [Acidimicrobiia bacterium]|jgi:hypothetical protein